MEKLSDNFMGNYLINNATYNPDFDFAVYGNERETWKKMNERVNKLAQALIGRGVKKEDKVLLMFHNCPRFLETNYAIQKCGAIPVPVNYRFTPPEIEFQANHSDAQVFVLEDIWLDSVQKARAKLKKVKYYICSGSECPSDMDSYEKIMEIYPPKEPHVPTDEDDVCVICYTGGTTGFPKGVMLTYGAHLAMFEEFIVSILLRMAQIPLSDEQIRKIKESTNLPGIGLILSLLGTKPVKWLMARELTSDLLHRRVNKMLRDVKKLRKGFNHETAIMFPSFPLFHDASYQLSMLAPIVGNQKFVLPDSVKLDPEKVFAHVEREKPNLMANVPTGWKMLIESPAIKKYDLSSVVFCASGAGLCPAELKKKILAIFKGAIFLDLFGQTEMTPITSFRMDSTSNSIKERSVGKPMVQTRIVDENGKDVPAGQIGEIIYKSKTVMKGYYKDEEKTAQTIKDGWFYSGDLGYFDENGEIRVVERKNECITTGGEKVFPLEVEQVISEHPDVKYVCVIGVPDETWGTSVCAVIQPKEGKKPTLEDILAVCEGKLAGYKKPKSIVLADDFPLSPVGKILRNKVRELYGKPQ